MANDSQKIRLAIAEATRDSREISDACARVIASQWHGGQNTIGYAFASTGAITDASEVYRDLFGDAYSTASHDDKQAMNWLGTYLIHRRRETQGRPIPGWSNLWL